MNMHVTMMTEICKVKDEKIEDWAYRCSTQYSKKQWQKSIQIMSRLKKIWMEALGATVLYPGSKRLKKVLGRIEDSSHKWRWNEKEECLFNKEEIGKNR